MKKLALLIVLLTAVLSGCLHPQARLTDNDLKKDASAWPLKANDGFVFTDNDAAFQNKIKMIRGATQSIDLSYYIYSDDYSSSYLSRELIAKAKSGVKVRLLVDYETNYANLDLFSMLEEQGKGAGGAANLTVRFYNRPTANIVKDAVYMTMGCPKGKAQQHPEACSPEKFAEVDKLFADEKIDGVPVAGRNISNLDIGNSGLFLSGLYSKRGDLIAQAVVSGEGIDPKAMKQGAPPVTAEQKENLKKLAKIYWQSKTGNLFQMIAADAELYFIFGQFGQQLKPIKNQVTAILPVDRQMGPDELRDWDHYTDYTHHKFLLVDGSAVQMGGRNVEDSYHMNPDPLVNQEKTYIFMDTDIFASLNGGAEVGAAFDKLWNFTPMVARLEEVRQQAPNDFVVNLQYAEETCSSVKGSQGFEPCVAEEQQAHVHDLAARLADQQRNLEKNARIYQESYLPGKPQGAAGYRLDPGSVLGYLENLPFDKDLPADQRRRSYGALSGQEAEGDKYIHDVWIREIDGICAQATPSDPKRIILHNAYFFPAANLNQSLSRLVDGKSDCSNVTVSVLTNSFDTTDLNVVNLMAHQTIRAFTEYYLDHKNPRQAKFEYFEYQKPPATEFNRSLHSKVSVFGDDIVIGSANADVRSFMMDSNNAMLVRNAPVLIKDYLAFVDGILANPARVKNLNKYFETTPHDKIKAYDEEQFWNYIERKFKVYQKESEERKTAARKEVSDLIDKAYEMGKKSLSSGKRSDQDKFNEQFKPI